MSFRDTVARLLEDYSVILMCAQFNGYITIRYNSIGYDDENTGCDEGSKTAVPCT